MESGKLPDDVWDLALVYPKHMIVDQPGITLDEMSEVVSGFEEQHKERPAFVVVDYLELLGGAKASGEGYLATERQATMLKDWAKTENMRVFVVHQTNRMERQWMPPTEDSARNAGFTEADFVVGLWRPHKNPALPYYDMLAMSDLLYINILKNRPFFKETDKIEMRLLESLRLEDKYEFRVDNTTVIEKS
jgi:hypothetical protein